jgi:hypothetical protein
MTSTTPPPSKRTVTDKLCDETLRLFVLGIEVEYEKAFPYLPAPDWLFEQFESTYAKLAAKLEQRPITKAEIQTSGRKAGLTARHFLRKAAAEVTQPRFQEQVNIATGETKLIPHTDDC